jgi:hypothetical protein
MVMTSLSSPDVSPQTTKPYVLYSPPSRSNQLVPEHEGTPRTRRDAEPGTEQAIMVFVSQTMLHKHLHP